MKLRASTLAIPKSSTSFAVLLPRLREKGVTAASTYSRYAGEGSVMTAPYVDLRILKRGENYSSNLRDLPRNIRQFSKPECKLNLTRVLYKNHLN